MKKVNLVQLGFVSLVAIAGGVLKSHLVSNKAPGETANTSVSSITSSQTDAATKSTSKIEAAASTSSTASPSSMSPDAIAFFEKSKNFRIIKIPKDLPVMPKYDQKFGLFATAESNSENMNNQSKTEDAYEPCLVGSMESWEAKCPSQSVSGLVYVLGVGTEVYVAYSHDGRLPFDDRSIVVSFDIPSQDGLNLRTGDVIQLRGKFIGNRKLTPEAGSIKKIDLTGDQADIDLWHAAQHTMSLIEHNRIHRSTMSRSYPTGFLGVLPDQLKLVAIDPHDPHSAAVEFEEKVAVDSMPDETLIARFGIEKDKLAFEYGYLGAYSPTNTHWAALSDTRQERDERQLERIRNAPKEDPTSHNKDIAYSASKRLNSSVGMEECWNDIYRAEKAERTGGDTAFLWGKAATKCSIYADGRIPD